MVEQWPFKPLAESSKLSQPTTRFTLLAHGLRPSNVILLIMHFKLKNIELDVFLGVPEDERKNKQTVLVSVFFEFDSSKAELSDEIADSVDYFEIYQVVKSFEGKEFKLIEKLHREIYDKIETNFEVKNLELQLEKRPFDDARILVK